MILDYIDGLVQGCGISIVYLCIGDNAVLYYAIDMWFFWLVQIEHSTNEMKFQCRSAGVMYLLHEPMKKKKDYSNQSIIVIDKCRTNYKEKYYYDLSLQLIRY